MKRQCHICIYITVRRLSSTQPVKPLRKPNRLELETGFVRAAGLGGRGTSFRTAPDEDDDPSFIEVARLITGACIVERKT
jgi:hypothetical protein